MRSSLYKQHKRARTLSLVLLFFLGISALPAALAMIVDPFGNKIGLSLELLQQSPFNNFLIPGLFLGLFNGILSLLFAILVLKRHPLQAWMVIFQGIVLLVWLTAEVIMGLYYPPMTLSYYLIALLLVSGGLLMKQFESGLS